MRIKSSFKDYYDGCQQYTQDDMVYIRSEQKVRDIYFNYDKCGWRGNTYQTYYRNIRIGFCGKLYLGYKFGIWNKQTGKFDETKYIYSLQEIKDLYLSHGWEWEEKITFYGGNHFIKEHNKCDEWNRTGYFNQYFNQHLTPIIVSSDVGKVTEQIKFRGKVCNKITHVEDVTINARLNQYNFQTLFDPQQAYQEIRMFLSNMAFPNRPIPKISDEDMLQAKGFDPKWSFRKEPK